MNGSFAKKHGIGQGLSESRSQGDETMIQGDSGGLVERLRAVTEPLCQAENMELVHIECLPDRRGPLLRIYLDKPGGITLDDCAYMSRQLGDLIDIQLEDLESYRLEVSSPGVDRPLSKEADFMRFKGSRVRIETRDPIDGRRRFTGLLKGMSGNRVTLEVDNQVVDVPFEMISRARLKGTHGE